MSDTARAHLDARLAQEQVERRLPSVVALVLRDGAPVWSAGVGTADGTPSGPAVDAATPYRIGSITKVLTALLVLRLVADGEVGLADPVRAHLPELDPSLDGVRVAELLMHTGGLAAETHGPWWERSPGPTWQELLPSVRRVHTPGLRLHYSNVGYAVLGRLVERRRGRPWTRVLEAEVLGPLGMAGTTYHPGPGAARGLAVHPYADVVHDEPAQDTGAMAPAGQLWSTASDLARLGAFLARGDERLLPGQLLETMRTPGAVWDTPGSPWTQAHGPGLAVLDRGGRRRVGHGGSVPGFQAALWVEPGSGDGAVVLTSSTTGPGPGLVDDLLDLARDHLGTVPRPWQPAPTPALDLVGCWYWGPQEYRMTARADGCMELRPAGAGRRASVFRPDGPDRWRGLDDYWAGEVLAVVGRGTAGAVLDLASFRLTRTPYDPAGDIPGGTDPAGWHVPGSSPCL